MWVILALLLLVSSAKADEVETVEVQEILNAGAVVSLVSFRGDSLILVRKTLDRDDGAVFGIFLHKMSVADSTTVARKGKTSGIVGRIRVSGTGVILVTNTGGNIAIGDLLSPSTKAGYAERQTVSNLGLLSETLVRNKTIGKAQTAVIWENEPLITKLIWCKLR